MATIKPIFMGNIDTYRREAENPNSYLNTGKLTIDNGSSNSDTSVDSKSTYDLQKDQAYEELLDKEISLENAKSNALKYTKNTINANGFGGTGYGSTLQTGIYNNYLNKVNEGVDEYNTKVEEIDATERAANLESVESNISSSASVENLNTYMAQKGYGTVDEDGNFTWGEKPADMSDDDWVQIQTDYNNQVTNLGGNDDYSGAYYTSKEDFNNVKVNNQTVSANFQVERDRLFSEAANGSIAYNGVVKITNNSNNTFYVQYTKNGMRVVDEATYNKAKNKYLIGAKRGANQQWWDFFDWKQDWESTFEKVPTNS